jgi:CheY-like chemotaxis protein
VRPATRTDKRTVLIVDDEVAIGHMLAACCDMWGMEAVVASTALEALTLIAERVPDLIVSDFMMPGMDGHEFLRTVRGDRRTRKVPLILMSSVPDAARRNSPADAFLPKPLDLDETERTFNQCFHDPGGPRAQKRSQ